MDGRDESHRWGATGAHVGIVFAETETDAPKPTLEEVTIRRDRADAVAATLGRAAHLAARWSQ